MPFDFPLGQDSQQTFMEALMADLQSVQDQADPFQITQILEPTQANWVVAWETAGNTLPIPENKDLYWFDGEFLRGIYSVASFDKIAPSFYPQGVSQPISTFGEEPTNAFHHQTIVDLRWRTNQDFWGIASEDIDATNFSIIRAFPDGSYANEVTPSIQRGWPGPFIGQNHAPDLCAFQMRGFSVELENTTGASSENLELKYTGITPQAGQVVRLEATVSKREAGTITSFLRVADNTGGSGDAQDGTPEIISGAVAPRFQFVEITATANWNGIRMFLYAHSGTTKLVWGGLRLFIDGVEQADFAQQHFEDGTTTGWIATANIVATIVDSFWAVVWDGIQLNWLAIIPEGPSGENHEPFHIYEDSGGDYFVIFGWLDLSISVYDTGNLSSNVLSNAATYGGATWDQFVALDNKIFAITDTLAIRQFDEDGSNNVAITIDVTNYFTGRDGILYDAIKDSATSETDPWWASIDTFDYSNDTYAADETLFSFLQELQQQGERPESLSGRLNKSTAIFSTIARTHNPFYELLETPQVYTNFLFLSPDGSKWLVGEKSFMAEFPSVGLSSWYVASNGSTGRVFRAVEWSDPRPDFRIIDEITFVADEEFSNLFFNLGDYDLEEYDILMIDMAIDTVIGNQKDIYMQFNDDVAAANYGSYLYTQSAAVRAHDEEVGTVAGVHVQAWQNGASALGNNVNLLLIDYKNPRKTKTITGHIMMVDAYTPGNYYQEFLCGIWDDVSPITKINFTIEGEGTGERLGANADAGYIKLIGLKTRARYSRDGDDPFYVA